MISSRTPRTKQLRQQIAPQHPITTNSCIRQLLWLANVGNGEAS
jgi:hypothetical protein